MDVELPLPNIVKEKEIYGPNANPWEVFDDSSTPWIITGKFEKTVYVFARLTKKALPCTDVNNKKKKLSSGVGKEQYVKKAGCGTWHGEGRKEIMDSEGENIIGIRRLLVFEINDTRGLKDRVGYWKMHEFSLCGYEDYVLCQITLDMSKNAKIVSLCPKTVSRRRSSTTPKANKKMATRRCSSTTPKANKKMATNCTAKDDSEKVMAESSQIFRDSEKEVALIQDFRLVEESKRMMTDHNLLVSTSCVCPDGFDQGIVNKGLPQYDDFSRGSKNDVSLDSEDIIDDGSWSEKDIANFFEDVFDSSVQQQQQNYKDAQMVMNNTGDFENTGTHVFSDFSSGSKDNVDDFFDGGSWLEKDIEEFLEDIFNNNELQQQNMSCSEVLGKRKSFETQEYCPSKKLRTFLQ